MVDTDAGGPDPRATLAGLFRGQAGWCRKLGSPIYGEMLERAAADMEAGGPVWRTVEPYADKPLNFATHLRLMGATHRLALAGEAPALAAHYPSTGGGRDPELTWDPFIEVLEGQEITLDRAGQTQQGGPAAALPGGLLPGAGQSGPGPRVVA